MKKRFIAGVLTCAMLLMGTGYAYWTDIINVSATASTGNLNVKFTEASYLGNNFVATGALKDESAYDFTGRTPSLKGESNVSFDITNLYPGHYEMFKTSVQNAGTVAAKLGKVAVGLSGNGSLAKDMIGIAIAATDSYTTTQTTPVWVDGHFEWKGCHLVWIKGYWDSTTTSTDNTGNVDLNLPAGSTFTIDNVTFIRLSSLTDANVADQVANLLYLTNKSKMDFVVTIGMDADAAGNYTTGSAQARKADKDDTLTQGKYEAVNLSLVWDQYNER